MKKITLSLLVLLLMLSTTACTKKDDIKTNGTSIQDEVYKEVQQEFDQYLTDLYVEVVSSDTLSLHYSLVNPEKYGIEQKEVSLGEISIEEDTEHYDSLREELKALDQFNIEKLTSKQQVDYKMVKNYLTIQLGYEGLDMYGYLFSSAHGITSSLVTNFTEYRIYEDNDFDEYLTLLRDIPRYFDEGIAYGQLQVDAGLFMQDHAIDETIEEIDKFINKVNSNELILTFDPKVKASGLDAEKQAEIIAENKRIVIDEVIPAYAKVKEQLQAWKGSATTENGYASLPGGKEFYMAFFKSKTGYMGEIDDIFNLGTKAMKALDKQIIKLMTKDADLYDRYVAADYEVKDPEAILADFQEYLTSDYPQGPEVSYIAEYLDQSIANESTMAYYLIPPFDNPSENVIRINPANKDNMKSLYPTLAHEGFPGHLYQTTYYFATNPNPIRTVFDSLGYTEGWAMYTEYRAFDWLLPDDAALADMMSVDVYYPYLIQALVDIGIHYYGWDIEETLEFLEEYGTSYGYDTLEIAESLHDFSTSNPGILLPYGMGLLQMETLRANAEKKLGKKFDVVKYNQVILETGSVTFDILEKRISEYIKANK